MDLSLKRKCCDQFLQSLINYFALSLCHCLVSSSSSHSLICLMKDFLKPGCMAALVHAWVATERVKAWTHIMVHWSTIIWPVANRPLHYNTTSVIAKSWTHIMVDTWVAIQFSFLLTDQESELDKDMLVPAVVVFDQWLGWDWTSRSTHSFASPSSYTDCTRAALLLSSHVNL